MLRSKLGLLGLSVVALSLMGIAASSASAAEWLILNSKGEVKTATELPAEISSELEKAGRTLLTRIAGTNGTISCTTASLANARLETGGKLTSGSSVTFGGCAVSMPSGCTVSSVGQPTETIRSQELKGQLWGNGEILIEPKTGTVLVELIFEGALCPWPTGVAMPIHGSLWLKDCEGKMATHLVTHLIQESTANGRTMWYGKVTQEHLEILLDGSALISLTGGSPTHGGLAWGGQFP